MLPSPRWPKGIGRTPGISFSTNAAAFVALTPEITPRIHDLAVEMEGSFSAEHGIGQLKKPELARYRSATDLALMAALKRALDPKGIMNPGKVL